MAKITLSDPVNMGSSAVTTITANNNAIETALENTLSRDGTSPNQMEATLDMNSNRIINLPEATTNTEPVRYGEFVEISDAVDDLNAAVAAAQASANSAAGSAVIASAAADEIIAANPIDVYFVLGQSNATGAAHPLNGPYLSPNPIVGTVYKYRGGTVQHGNDPTGPYELGSAWPMFGITSHRLTGKPCLIVNTAVGSTALAASADGGQGNWSSTGTLLPAAFVTGDAAIAAAEALGFTVATKTVCWVQGEGEASIYGGLSGPDQAALQSEYKNELVLLINACWNHWGFDTRFWMWETGTADGGDLGNYQAIRDWQNSVISIMNHPHARIVSRMQKHFDTLDMMESGELHWNQTGCDLAGAVGASNGILGRNVSVVQLEGVHPNAEPYTIVEDSLRFLNNPIVTPAMDFSMNPNRRIVIGNGSNAVFKAHGAFGASLLCIRDAIYSGDAALVFLWQSSVTFLDNPTTNYVNSTTPGAGKIGVIYTGGEWTIYNNRGDTVYLDVTVLQFSKSV